MLPLLMPTSEISKLGFGEFGVGRATQRDEVDGGAEGGERESEEEEKFFDAPEISAEEWAKSTRAEFLEGEEDPTAVPEGAGGPAAADLPPFSSKPMELVSQRGRKKIVGLADNFEQCFSPPSLPPSLLPSVCLSDVLQSSAQFL